MSKKIYRHIRSISIVVLLFFIICLRLSSVAFSEKGKKVESESSLDGSKVISDEPTTLSGGREELVSEGYNFSYSNGKLGLYAGLDGFNKGSFALENKEDGSLWYTSQPDSSMDAYAINMFELRSMLILETYSKESGSLVRYNSKAHSVEEDGLSILQLEKGLKFIFTFPEIEIVVPVIVLINDDSTLTINIDISEIQENGVEKIFNMEILPFFMAGNEEDQGGMLVPDGSGAIMKFNNGKTIYSMYNQSVYAGDASEILSERKSVSEQIHMPIMGIFKNSSGAFSIISKGAAQSNVSATVSGISSGYNRIWSSSQLRKVSTYSLDKGWQGSRTFYIFQETSPTLPEVELKYFFLENGKSDLNGMAETYQNHLISENDDFKLDEGENKPIVYVDYLGSVERKKSVVGIPTNSKIEITSYKNAKKITENLIENGVENLVVGYQNWNSKSISKKIINEAKADSVLGGRKDLLSLSNYLKEKNIEFYPNVELNEFERSSFPLQQYSYATRNMNNEISKNFQYKLNTYIHDKKTSGWYTLSLNKIEKTSLNFMTSYSKLGFDSISLGEIVKKQTSDYSDQKKPIELWKGQEIYNSIVKRISKDYNVILSEANLPSALLASHVINAPKSSGYDMCDYAVPFYQMTLSGLVSYVGRPINLSANIRSEFLYALSTGSGLHYVLSENSESDNIKGTRFNEWIGTNHEVWNSTIKEQSQEMKEIYLKLGGSAIKSYKMLENGLVISSFTKGDLVINFDAEPKDYYDIEVKAQDYLIVNGGVGVE